MGYVASPITSNKSLFIIYKIENFYLLKKKKKLRMFIHVVNLSMIFPH